MSTILADTYTNAVAISSPSPQDISQSFSYVTGGAFAPTTGSVLYLAKIPKGACILGWTIWVPALDSGTTITLNLGLLNVNSATAGLKGATATTSNAAIFLSASTIGQAGGLTTERNATNGIVTGCVPTAPIIADDVLTLAINLQGDGAGTGGTLKGCVRYFCHTNVW